ncbi:hypothetical protein [Sorangium sp. So ce204]|uniref:hypothetical protein n=1 Tax=Sorangium sp. So ce204 TaxID=3133288 RepID=UPI003F618CC0
MVAALVALRAAAPSRADTGPPRARVRIELTRGPGTERCPDGRFLRAAIARRMGFDPFDAEAPLLMEASIEGDRGELIASIYLRDRRGVVLWTDGHRTRGDCKTLVSTAALLIAVQLDDMGELPPPQPAPAPQNERATQAEAPCSPERPCAGRPAPPPNEAPRSPPPPSKAPPARERPPLRAPPPGSAGQAAAERFHWTVDAGAAMALGLTPGVAVGPTLSVAGRWPAWSVALEARGLSSLSTNVDDVRVATSAFTANAALCLHRHALFACGVGELGVLRAVPEAPRLARTVLTLRAGLGARAGVRWPISEGLSGYGTAEPVWRTVDASLLRRRGIAGTDRAAWSAPALGVAFGIGLQLNL